MQERGQVVVISSQLHIPRQHSSKVPIAIVRDAGYRKGALFLFFLRFLAKRNDILIIPGTLVPNTKVEKQPKPNPTKNPIPYCCRL